MKFLFLFLASVIGLFSLIEENNLSVTKNQSNFGRNVKQDETKCLFNDVNLSISISSTTIKKDRKFYLQLRLENSSNEDLDLDRFSLIKLEESNQLPLERERWDKNFYAMADLINDHQQKIELKEKRFLQPGAILEAKIEISGLKWGSVSLSGSPNNNLGKVVPEGDYDLYLEFLQFDKEKKQEVTKKSNTIKVRVENETHSAVKGMN